MNKLMHTGFAVLLLVLAAPLLAEQVDESLGAGMVNPGYHDKPGWFKESFLDIREDTQEAAGQGKRLMLYFYQDGCPYCAKLLQDNFGDQNIAATTQQYFDVIAINMWGDREVTGFDGLATTEKAFARSLRVQFTPTLLMLNENGKVLLRLNGYYAPHQFDLALNYVGKHLEEKQTFREFVREAPVDKASGKLHTGIATLPAPLDLTAKSRTAGRPLLVLFEQPVCRACDELHQDIFKREAVQPALKPFDIVVLDMWSNDNIKRPDGKTQKIRDWAVELGIAYSPTMLFLDSEGNEVFRTEAYLKSFHTKAALDYVATGAYKKEPEFQRFVQKIADDLHARGIEFDLMD
ncbi:MAG: thioredoxin fold domain-containing protein [Chromatiales bacterium]|jgi:thioredoxin-related protein